MLKLRHNIKHLVERSNSTSVFKLIEGKCYNFNEDKGRTFQQAENYCQNVFGFGKSPPFLMILGFGSKFETGVGIEMKPL